MPRSSSSAGSVNTYIAASWPRIGSALPNGTWFHHDSSVIHWLDAKDAIRKDAMAARIMHQRPHLIARRQRHREAFARRERHRRGRHRRQRQPRVARPATPARGRSHGPRRRPRARDRGGVDLAVADFAEPQPVGEEVERGRAGRRRSPRRRSGGRREYARGEFTLSADLLPSFQTAQRRRWSRSGRVGGVAAAR